MPPSACSCSLITLFKRSILIIVQDDLGLFLASFFREVSSVVPGYGWPALPKLDELYYGGLLDLLFFLDLILGRNVHSFKRCWVCRSVLSSILRSLETFLAYASLYNLVYTGDAFMGVDSFWGTATLDEAFYLRLIFVVPNNYDLLVLAFLSSLHSLLRVGSFSSSCSLLIAFLFSSNSLLMDFLLSIESPMVSGSDVSINKLSCFKLSIWFNFEGPFDFLFWRV